MGRGLLFILKQIFLGIIDAIVIVSFFVLLVGVVVYYNTPNVAQGINENSKNHIAQTTTIYDRTGKVVLYELFGEENRKIVSHDEIPDVVRIATLAAEDDSFYDHVGIDLKSVMRALKTNVENQSIEEGASTITQQLARSLYLTNERTMERKIKEAVIALKIERKYTKKEILDMYLNQVPYGSNAYGVQTAAKTFFDKEAKDLTLDEAALIASLPKATTYYSPFGNNVDRLIKRQEYILKRINKLGLASKEEVDEALKIDTLRKIVPLKREIKAPHFVFYVLEKLESKYKKRYLEEGGFDVITTLDWEKQKKAEKIVREGAEKNLIKYNATNAALVAIDPRNGEILSMVGSKDYYNDDIDGKVNVTIRVRQPGSSFKPIVYAQAFQEGFQPETLLYDVRTDFGPDGSGRSYVPNNYNGDFYGLVSMRKALAMSLNVPAVKTLYLAGIDDVLRLAERMGYTTLTDRENYGLSLALGGGGINLLENTAAFSIFANDGKRNIPISILKIKDKTGNNDKYVADQNEIQTIDPQVARKINSILSDNKARSQTFGPNSLLHIPDKTVAAKTGTTQDFRDGWTIGYTPYISVGVWVGNNNNKPMKYGAAGLYVATPIWNEFMKEMVKDHKDVAFKDYKKVKSSRPMMAGKVEEDYVYYDEDGEKISKEKAKDKESDEVEVKKEITRHSILYYIENRSSLEKDFNKEMLKRWESSLRNDEKNKSDSDKE